MYVFKSREVAYMVRDRALELNEETIEAINQRFTKLYDPDTKSRVLPLSKQDIINMWEGRANLWDDEIFWSFDTNSYVDPKLFIQLTIKDLVNHAPGYETKNEGVIDSTYSSIEVAED